MLLVLKLYAIQAVILLPIMDKTHHGLVINVFSVQLLQLFSYIGGVLVTNLFSLLLIDRYILAI